MDQRMEERADLGILFVHGIGSQRPGDTLIQGTDPLCEFARIWLSSNGQTGTLNYLTGELKPHGAEPAHATVGITYESGSEPEPSNHRVLFAESYWADAFVPPPHGQFSAWLLSVVPFIVGRHFGLRAKRHWAQQSRFRAVMRVAQLELMWLLCPILVLLLAIVSVAWVIPMRGLRDVVKRIQLVIAATLGDSFALLFSPLNEQAIRTRFLRSLEWLAERASRVVVIAHSQGAWVASSGLSEWVGKGCSSERAPVTRLITYGPGLRKLADTYRAQEPFQRLLCWLAMLALPVLLLAAASSVFADSTTLLSIEGIPALLFLALGLVVHISGLRVCLEDPELTAIEPLATCIPWTDLHASHDPVANGALSSTALAGLEDVQVTNQRSLLRDHNVYWQNIDQFVPAVAARAFDGLPGPLGQLRDPAPSVSIARASQVRDELTDTISVIRLYWLAAAVVLFAFSQSGILWAGRTALNVLRWGHDSLAAAAGDDVVGALPRRLDDYPGTIGAVIVVLLFMGGYRLCMQSWNALVRQNRDAIVSAEPKRVSSRVQSFVLGMSSLPLLFAMLPLEQTLGEDIIVMLLTVSLFGGVGWPVLCAFLRKHERHTRQKATTS